MKKTNLIIPAVLLSLCPISCQKETLVDCATEMTESRQPSQIHINYFIDGNCHTVTLANETSLTKLIHDLNSLAVEGHHVRISNNDCQSVGMDSKETLHIETKDAKEIEDWAKKMVTDGYEVTIIYDKESGVYSGTAIKK